MCVCVCGCFSACLGKHTFILLQAAQDGVGVGGLGWVGVWGLQGAEHGCICAYHSNYTASSLNKQAAHIINIPQTRSQAGEINSSQQSDLGQFLLLLPVLVNTLQLGNTYLSNSGRRSCCETKASFFGTNASNSTVGTDCNWLRFKNVKQRLLETNSYLTGSGLKMTTVPGDWGICKTHRLKWRYRWVLGPDVDIKQHSKRISSGGPCWF